MQLFQVPDVQERGRKALARRRTSLDLAIGEVEKGQMEMPFLRDHDESTKVLLEAIERDADTGTRSSESRDGLAIDVEEEAYDLGSPCKRRQRVHDRVLPARREHHLALCVIVVAEAHRHDVGL